jgi:hypothetical protein
LGFGFDLALLIILKKHSNYSQCFDVGYIKHSKQVETWTYKGLYKYEGVNPIFNDSNDPGNVYQEFNDAIPLDSIYTKYTTWRPQKLNASYQLFNDSRGELQQCC